MQAVTQHALYQLRIAKQQCLHSSKKGEIMFAKILSILIVGGLIAFSAYQIVQIVRTVKERKKAKSIKKENDKQ